MRNLKFKFSCFATLLLISLMATSAFAQTVTEFSAGITPGAAVRGMASGPDGNIWFTQEVGNRIGRVTPLGVITEFSAGITASSSPIGITTGPDNNLWFCEFTGNQIGRITAAGVVTEFSAGATFQPLYITSGPDGALWFTKEGGNSIGRITTAGVVTDVFTTGISAGSAPGHIVTGPDGNLWFTERLGNRIARITPAGVVTEFSAGVGTPPSGIAAGPDGNLWYTFDTGIGRITTAGVVTQFTAGITPGLLRDIHQGSDGNLYFTNDSGRLGRITPAGVITEFTAGISGSAGLFDITLGPDSRMWFSEYNGNRVARLTMPPDILSGLQSAYRCDGDALDSSGGLRHLIPSFGTLDFFVDGRYGRACQFDGFTQVKSANSAFTQSNSVTYAFWMKKTTPRTVQETIMQTVTGATTSNILNSIDYQTSPAQLRFWGDNLSPFTISSTPAPTLVDSTWHHVAITSSGMNSSVLMYIDGAVVPVTVTGTNSVTDLATTFYLGARSDLLPSNLENYLGFMDDVRIYNRVLAPFDVAELVAPPGIGDVVDITVNEDIATGTFNFSVNDLQTPAASLSVVASSSNPTLVPPANITLGGTGTARTISVSPAPNESGTSTIMLTVTDGDLKTSNVDFLLTVNPVNDAPTFSAGSNQSTLEDAGPQSIPNWASAIDDGDPDATQTLNFVVTPVSSVDLTFSVLPSISPSGTLSYTTTPDSNGFATFSVRLDDNGGTSNGGVNQSTQVNFTISATPVNDAPSFTAGANQSVFEDAGPQSISGWATAINAHDSEVFQSVTFVVTPLSGTVNFSAFPTVSTSGTLSYTSAPDSVGSATFSVHAMDDGGTANGGVDQSPDQMFTISVGPINDAPSFTAGANQSLLEDAGPQSISNWASAIDSGDPEAAQTVSFVVTPISGTVNFSAFPTVSTSGTLSYTSAPDSVGSATFSVHAMDDGGTANGGVDQSPDQMFTISVGPINDAPSFTAGANQSLLEDAGPQSISNWASAIDSGDPEAAQTVSFVVTPISGTVNFSAFPTVSTSGTLSFTSSPDSVGSATFTVHAMDDGGTANGGVDQSADQTFTITVGPVNDAPTIAALSNLSTNEDTATAPIAISLADVDDPVSALTLSATTSNAALVPIGNVVFSGSGASRTAVITPEPDSSGTSMITVIVDDGTDVSSSTFTLTVNAVNDAPTIAPFGDISTLEDTASGANAITVGDIDSAVASLTLSATSSNLVLAPVANIVFGGTGASRTVIVTPAPDQSGSASITMSVSDGIDSTTRTFNLNVFAVNDLPSFTVGANQSLLFGVNAAQSISNWATAINDGDADFVQALSFNVSNSNNALFSVQPSVAANGTLSYTTTGLPGTATVSVSLTDDASAGGPGALTTAVQTFDITVAANTAPSLSAVSAQSTNEDTTSAAIAFTVSDVETAATSLVVTTASSNTSLIPLANIAIAGTGSNRSLSITPAANLSGASTITINLSDGTDTSTQNFVLTVNPINDVPSFTKGADQVLAPGISGAQAISNWASLIDDGDADFTQALNFNVSNDNPTLFSVQPSVSATGTLSYTPAAPAIAGTANVTLSLSDDATAGGGALASPSQSFSIIVQAVPVVSIEQRTPASTVVGQPFSVRVRVRNPTGSLVPTGTLSVVPLPVGATVQCNLSAIATPPGSAEAICANVISPIASGKLVLAVYDGDAVFVLADANDVHPVSKAATALHILEDLPDPSPSNTPVAVRYQLEVLAPSVAPLSSLNGIITLSDGLNQTSAPFSLSNPVISLVLQGDGPRTLTARYSSDSNFLDSSATETHTLTGGNNTDLSVSVSNGKRYVQGGGEAVYLIKVRNLGGINSSAQLNAFVPDGLSNYHYTCIASAGSSCHAASGTGAIIAAINVAAGGEVVYTARANVVATEPGTVTQSALIVPASTPPDSDASNNSASDTDIVALYLDGFED